VAQDAFLSSFQAAIEWVGVAQDAFLRGFPQLLSNNQVVMSGVLHRSAWSNLVDNNLQQRLIGPHINSLCQ